MSTDDQVRLIRTELISIAETLDDLLRLARERLPEPTKDEPIPEPRTWALPEEPPEGARLIDRDDCAWGRDHDAWRWLSSKGKLLGIGVGWHYLLYCGGPLREATPDDLARLGIDQEENR